MDCTLQISKRVLVDRVLGGAHRVTFPGRVLYLMHLAGSVDYRESSPGCWFGTRFTSEWWMQRDISIKNKVPMYLLEW